MSPEKKKQCRCDLLTTIALFLGLVFTCRLWPLLLLMMLGVFTYAIWALVENERQRAVPSPPPLLALPAPISEQELISNAFGLLPRRITEELTRDFPRAKWVWGQTGARLCFAAGDDLVILLADAEGRRSATVRTNELQFSQLLYHPYQPQPTDPEPDTHTEDPAPEEGDDDDSGSVDFGLLAFEWVDANLQQLNGIANEAVAKGQYEFLLQADELPHGDSWAIICKELVRNGFRTAEAMAEGIRVQIKS